jgi:hypothetical protein
MPAWLWPFILLPLVWTAAMALASAGGWGAVARAYPARGHRPAHVRRFRSLEIRAGWLPNNYSGIVTVGADPGGLFFAVFAPFRPFHRPIYVPWPSVRTEARKGWLGSHVELRFDGVPGVVFKMSKGLAEQLADACRAWPAE